MPHDLMDIAAVRLRNNFEMKCSINPMRLEVIPLAAFSLQTFEEA